MTTRDIQIALLLAVLAYIASAIHRAADALAAIQKDVHVCAAGKDGKHV